MVGYRSLRACTTAVSLVVCLARLADAGEESFLFVKSTPPGARISVDGVPSPHKTPRVVRGIPPGRHLIVLELDGYSRAQTEISVDAGMIETIDLALSEANAASSVTVNSTPQGATVWIDTIERGNTPVTVEDLAAGTHQLLVVLEDYEDLEKEIVVRAGATESLELQLAKSAPPEGTRGDDPTRIADAPEEEDVPDKIEVDCPYCKGSGLITSIGCSDCRTTGRWRRRACPKCDGDGRLDYKCPLCKGEGKLPDGRSCRGCAEKGYLPCTACAGKGKILRYNRAAAEGETRDCVVCGGTGFDNQTPCRICTQTGSVTVGAEGTRLMVSPITAPCKACGGDGKGPPICPACSGMGNRGSNKQRVHCSKCCGTGKLFVPCRSCRGRGFLVLR